MNRHEPLFSLGTVVATPLAIEQLDQADIAEALVQHARGDWGVVCDQDAAANDEALKSGARLFSVNVTEAGKKIWIITEADRSSTCVLLPEEY